MISTQQSPLSNTRYLIIQGLLPLSPKLEAGLTYRFKTKPAEEPEEALEILLPLVMPIGSSHSMETKAAVEKPWQGPRPVCRSCMQPPSSSRPKQPATLMSAVKSGCAHSLQLPWELPPMSLAQISRWQLCYAHNMLEALTPCCCHGKACCCTLERLAQTST